MVERSGTSDSTATKNSIHQNGDSVKPDAKKSKADADFESFDAEDFFRILKMSKEERKAFVKLEQARACLEKALWAAGDVRKKGDSVPENAEGVVENEDSVKKSKEKAHPSPDIELLTEDDLPAYLNAGSRANKSKLQALKDGKQIILTSKSEITEFIDSAIEGKDDLNTVAYGKVSERLAADVEAYSNGKIDVEGSYLELVPDDIHHAYKNHHNAKESGNIDLSREDFENIPLYINDYDELVYAIRYKSGATRICLSKKLQNGRAILIETVSRSRGSIEFKNIIGLTEERYISDYQTPYKKGNSTNTGGDLSPTIPPRDETVSTNSIHQNGDSVKPDAKKSKADADFESFSAEEFFREAAARSVSEVVGESEKSTKSPEAPRAAKKRGLSEGQAKKLEANYVNHKTFSRKEVAEVVDSITRKHLDFGEDYGVLIGKGRQEAAKRFFA